MKKENDYAYEFDEVFSEINEYKFLRHFYFV